MHVVATAGHVDHGKSALVRALTGMEPDRWEEERRRGLTVDLGFVWSTLDSGRQVAYVDVPGHERFVTNMLAGVGPVPSVLFVVAADEGWKPQSTEHLDALDALGVSSGLLVITRSDLADPEPARHAALERLYGTSLAGIESVAVSARTGTGLDELRASLDVVLAAAPDPDPSAPVRLWIDRVFTVRGAGTVVTGTLPAGTVEIGQTLCCEPGGHDVDVRGLETLQERVTAVRGISRVAVNLRGVDRPALRRGDALVTPGAWTITDVVDAGLVRPVAEPLPEHAMLHIGSSSVPVRIRPLGKEFARITLSRPLAFHCGDRALLRDPSAHRVLTGLRIADVLPPELLRRGAAAARADELARRPGIPAPLLRHGLIRAGALTATGAGSDGLIEPARGWLADPQRWEALRARLQETVAEYLPAHPLDVGMPVDTARRALGMPDSALVAPLIAPPLAIEGGHIVHTGRASTLTPAVGQAFAQVRAALEEHPFQAPEAGALDRLGLHRAELAALVRADALVHLGGGIYLLPAAEDLAVERLTRLPQPFTVSQARQELGTTRRVAVPLLEWLDQRGHTRRQPDDTRRITNR